MKNTSDLPMALAAPLRSLTTEGGTTLRYYASERGDGPPVVLLHSINAAPSAMEMKPVFEFFQGRRPVYALDLPGFGQSQRGPLDYTPQMFASVITQFLDAIGEEVSAGPPHLVALSLACEFSARAVVELGAKVSRLAFISPTGLSRRLPPSPAAGRRIARVLRAPFIAEGLFRALTSKPSVRYFLGQTFVGETPPELIDYAWCTARVREASDAPLAFLSMQLFTATALSDFYSGLRCPTLILYDRDPNIDFDRLPTLLAENQHIRAERIAGTLGMPHWEQPEITLHLLEDFLQAANHPAASSL